MEKRNVLFLSGIFIPQNPLNLTPDAKHIIVARCRRIVDSNLDCTVQAVLLDQVVCDFVGLSWGMAVSYSSAGIIPTLDRYLVISGLELLSGALTFKSLPASIYS